MPVETATYIQDLKESWPVRDDPISDGDNHLTLIKAVLKNTFPEADKPQAPVGYPEADAGSIITNNGTHWVENAKVSIDADGNIRCEGEIEAKGNVYSLSDDRLKDVQKPVTDALDKVKALDCFHFTPNENGVDHGMRDQMQVGVSAQQVQAVLPELVSTEGDYLRVDYPKLTVLLLAAVKELASAD